MKLKAGLALLIVGVVLTIVGLVGAFSQFSGLLSRTIDAPLGKPGEGDDDTKQTSSRMFTSAMVGTAGAVMVAIGSTMTLMGMAKRRKPQVAKFLDKPVK